MKKIFAAIATASAVSLAALGIGVGSASAHSSDLSYDCTTVTASFSEFPSTGTNNATVTVAGVPHDFSWTGATYVAHVTFVSHSGDPDVVVTSVYSSTQDNYHGSDSATFSADSCSPPPTTAPPTTAPPTTTTLAPVVVSPAEATRPAVVAAAVVAAPVFTG